MNRSLAISIIVAGTFAGICCFYGFVIKGEVVALFYLFICVAVVSFAIRNYGENKK